MKTRSRCVARLAGIVGALALSMGQVALAQQADAQSAVFVRDSTAAQDKLTLAQRMERLKEWDTAAQVYQEVIDQYGDRVLPTHKNDRGVTDRYVSVANVVQDRLALWPDEGREVYLSLYEPPAKLALEGAGNDATALGTVVNRYFVTDSGRIAAIRLFNLQFEDAMFAGAGVLGDRLLNHHPDLAHEAPMLMLRTAIAWKFSGDDARAAQMADRLAKEFPESIGKIGGVETNLSEWLKAKLSAPLGVQSRSFKWNTTFGGPDRTAVAFDTRPPGELGELGLIRSVPIGDLRTESMTSENDQQFMDEEESASEAFDATGAQTGVLPIADGDELFINDNNSVGALSLMTGEALPAWDASWPTTGGRFTSPGPSPRICIQNGLTVTDREVLAILDQPPPLQIRFIGADVFNNQTRLVCLERSNGTLRWQLAMTTVASDDESLKSTYPVGTPLVVNGRVYVVTRGGRSTQFEDVFLLCLDLESGRMIWSRHLMSGSSPTQMHIALRPAAPAAIYAAYADGRIYVASEIGAAAALNEADGSIVWLSLFERPVAQLNQRMFNNASMNERLPAFIANPPMIFRGRLWYVGTGDQTLYCFDTADGSIKLTMDLRALNLKDSASQFWILCGVDEEAVVLSSNRFVVTLDRKKLEDGSAARDALLWRSTIANESSMSLAGRPMVTSDSIYVATGANLRRIDRKRARVVGTYPARQSWRPADGGNVLVAGDSIVIAGQERVRIYSDLARIQQRLLADAEKNPTSPLPRLRLAQASFRSNHFASALDSLSKAVDLAKAEDSLQMPLGDSILVAANSMAHFFAREKELPDRDQLIGKSFEIIERASDEPAERAAFLIQSAREKKEKVPAEAINLLQQVMADPALDSIQVIGQKSQSSGDMAREMIQSIVNSRGAMLMQSIDARAQSELDEAIQSNNLDAMERVARIYPLSPASTKASTLLAEHYESLGDFGVAFAHHQRLVRNQNSANRPASLAALARLSLHQGHKDLALAYLKRTRAIVGEAPLAGMDSLKNAQGEALGTDLSSAIRNLEAQLDHADLMRLPQLGFNERKGSIAKDGITEVREVQELVMPEGSHTHQHRVIARMSGNQMSAFQDGQTAPLWSVTSAIQSNARCFWNEDAVTIAGAEAIEHVDQNGRLAWQVRVEQLKASQPEPAIVDSDNWLRATRNSTASFPVSQSSRSADMARQQRQQMGRRAQLRAGGFQGDFQAPPAMAPGGQRELLDDVDVSDQLVFASTTRGRVIGVDRQSGKVLWTRQVSDLTPQRLVFTGAVVGVIASDSSSSRLVMLDPATGDIIHSLVRGNGRANGFVNLGTDRAGLLLALTTNQLIAFDTLIDPKRYLFERDIQPLAGMEMSLVNNVRPDQIAFSRNRFAVLIDVDTNAQRVGLFESSTGEPVSNLDPLTNRRLQFSIPVVPSENTKASMRIVGDRIYISTTQSLMSYSISSTTSTPWTRRPVEDDPAAIAQFTEPMGRDLLVAVTYRSGRSTPMLETFSRAVVNDNVESGLRMDQVEINLPIALSTRWIAVDGGLYSKTTNGRLVYMPASK